MVGVAEIVKVVDSGRSSGINTNSRNHYKVVEVVENCRSDRSRRRFHTAVKNPAHLSLHGHL